MLSVESRLLAGHMQRGWGSRGCGVVKIIGVSYLGILEVWACRDFEV